MTIKIIADNALYVKHCVDFIMGFTPSITLRNKHCFNSQGAVAFTGRSQTHCRQGEELKLNSEDLTVQVLQIFETGSFP
jgi:hypothetical protein